MNIERMKLVLESIKDEERGFDMDVWFRSEGGYNEPDSEDLSLEDLNECGTVACIAGHACLIAKDRGDLSKEEAAYGYIPRLAAQWLDLSRLEADDLFMGYWQEELDFPKSEERARVISYLTQCIEEGRLLDEDEWEFEGA